MQPNLTLDLSAVALIRSDIRRIVRRAGGRSPYGHSSGNLKQGVGYWAGTVEFERLSKWDKGTYIDTTVNPPKVVTRRGGIRGISSLEAALAELQDGSKTFRVPMPNQSWPLFSVRIPPSTEFVNGDPGTLTTGSGGVVVSSTGAGVKVMPGTRMTVDRELYVAVYSEGEQTITSATPVTIPKWPTVSGKTVDIKSPYVIGRVRIGVDITMYRSGSWGGPWTIEWEEA